MKDKKKRINKLVLLLPVCLIVIGIGVYFFLTSSNSGKGKDFPSDDLNRRGDFQSNSLSLSDEEKTEITSFFENSPSSSEVKAYCEENRDYCFYYCFELKGSNEYCIETMNNRPTNNTQMPPRGEIPQ